MKTGHCVVAFLAVVIVAVAAYFIFSTNKEMVLDAKNQKILPANFRIVSNLKIIGSAQFSEEQLGEVLKKERHPLVIVDLREESHGFIDGNAISWMEDKGKGYVPTALSPSYKKSVLDDAKTMGITSAFIVRPNPGGYFTNQAQLPLPMASTATERQVVNELRIPYTRFPVSFQNVPAMGTVDDFINFSEAVPSNTWVYFHCRDGIKRTNLFMSMYDMLLNAKHADFETILHRDYIQKQSETSAFDAEEIAFLKQFYEYSRSNDDNFKTTWSQWKQNKG